MTGAVAASVLAGLMVSDAPRPELEQAFEPFVPLIGSWDLDVSWYDDDGRQVRAAQGEWHFAWALDGSAVADIWITPSRAERVVGDGGEWGLSVRIYDPELRAFRSTWMGPKHAFVMTFIGRPSPDGIILEAREPKTAMTRWIFTEITPTSFQWRNEDEAEGGTITVRQRFSASRAQPPG